MPRKTTTKPETPDTHLRKMGTYLGVNSEGYLVSEVSPDTIQPELRPCLDRIIEVSQAVFGSNMHSAYIRGSVAKRSFIPYLSDIDPVIVVKDEPSSEQVEVFEQAFKDLQTEFPEVTNIEKNWQTVRSFTKGTSPIYKYQCVCLDGEDLTQQLPELKPGIQTTVHMPKIIDSIDKSRPRIEALGQDNQRAIQHWSVWMAKQLIRTAHELVAGKLKRFARDIYPCYEGASEFYPEHELLFRDVAEIAVYGTADKRRLLDITDAMRRFLEPEILKFYEAEDVKSSK